MNARSLAAKSKSPSGAAERASSPSFVVGSEGKNWSHGEFREHRRNFHRPGANSFSRDARIGVIPFMPGD